jgi:hypothetical protein
MALPRLWPFVRRDPGDAPLPSEDGSPGDHPGDSGGAASGSLRAAEELTGHDDETIAVWLQRLGEHAEAITERLVHDLPLSEVEVDELWSFVSKKGVVTRRRGQAILRRRAGRGSAGAP